MRKFDWLLYVSVLGLIVLVLFAQSDQADAPEAPPIELDAEGPTLPPPSPLDEQILIQMDGPKDGVGTAFAVNRKGQWITARHVVDGCDSVGLLVAPGQYVPVESIMLDPDHDLALISTAQPEPGPARSLNSPAHRGRRLSRRLSARPAG